MRYEVCDCGSAEEAEVDAGSPEEAAEKFARQEDGGRHGDRAVIVTNLATGERGEYLVTVRCAPSYRAERWPR